MKFDYLKNLKGPNGKELPGKSETILWASADGSSLGNEQTRYYQYPIRPSFVEVAQ